ncbi:MAG: tRNA (adenosine(37)-N6)-threonylcarbamoyltransferase complex dimerization subunit type 1 TsaB [Steroidobacteraceae bacterium]
MRILALDTATEACSVAVLTPQGLHVRYLELEKGHSELILTLVDAVLAEAALELRQLDAVAFGRGPGGFTGVRLATSVAQGLAFAAQRPVVPISDLRALAQRALDEAHAARGVVACADARMKEVYWACFRRGPDGLAEGIGEERVGAPSTVELPPGFPGPVHGVGRGFAAYPALAASLSGQLASLRADLLPRAEEIARLAMPELEAGRTVPAELAAPVYLRNDVARPAVMKSS